MAPRLTDLQRKQIIADYIELGSYNAVAKQNKVSKDTVRRVVNDDAAFAQKAQHKKIENAEGILAHMESRREVVNNIIDVYLDELLSPQRIAKATAAQLATAMAIVIDKFTMKGIKDTSAGTTEDPLSAALKELAEELNTADD